MARDASLTTLRRVAAAIDARIVVDFRWDGASLDRLLGARHSALHEAVAGLFAGLPEWVSLPEVSFSIYGERGIIDVLAWHAPTRSLLVIELKTELADLQETLGTLDRKVRLAKAVAKERGWEAKTVSAWLLVADSTANRDRVQAHRRLLRSALPDDGPTMKAWLGNPTGQTKALSFLAAAGAPRNFAQPQRIGRRSPAASGSVGSGQ